ncbi:unnamed protein product [Cuscuta europaea]|uniref:MADS-box domain-containing protein n=1 Tax=Cuscuta europaea TaxID=41803 RepID=A0A9P0ZKG3_CUSEU|nr:unnamed protein product [Cuscuta europaea]
MVGSGHEGNKSEVAKFGRHRNAIVKRAKEICTLCASNVLIIIFSLGGQMFTFGDETIIDRYEEQNGASHECTSKCTIHKNPRIFKLQSWKNKKAKPPSMLEPSNLQNDSFDAFIEKLNLPQLQQLGEKMDGFRKNLADLLK